MSALGAIRAASPGETLVSGIPCGCSARRARSLHLSNPGSLVPLGEMGLAGRDRARYICKVGVERTRLDLEREHLEGTSEQGLL